MRVPRELHPLRLFSRIPAGHFTGGNPANIVGLHYDAETDELYVAIARQKTVNVLCPTTADSTPRPVYTAQAPVQPSSVCLVRQTGTLLIANIANDNPFGNFKLVALSRDTQQWRQQSGLQVTVETTQFNVCVDSTLCELANATVLLGAQFATQLLVLKLTPTHELSVLRTLQIGEYMSVSSAVLNGSSLVALVTEAASYNVSVNRLMEDKLEALSYLKPPAGILNCVLWAGEHLLLGEVSCVAQNMAIVELDTSRTPLARASRLLSPEDRVSIGCWCADGERVCVCDKNSNDILVYSVC